MKNIKNNIDKISKLLNSNFPIEETMVITLTYRNVNGREKEIDSTQELKSFLKRLTKHIQKFKDEKPIYLATTCGKEKSEKTRHTIFINMNISNATIETMWENGIFHKYPIFQSYEPLVRYLCKDRITQLQTNIQTKGGAKFGI